MVDKKNTKKTTIAVDDDEDTDVEVKKSSKHMNPKSKPKKADVDADNKIEAELGELADVSASLTGTIGKAGKSKHGLGVDSSINALL